MNEEKTLPKGWKWVKLGDICDRITKGGTPTTYGFSFVNNGINFIKVENIEGGRVNKKSIKNFISIEAHEFQKKSILEENDLLFSIAGTIGDTCLIVQEYLPANTNQALAILRGYHKHIIPKLLTYQLNSFVTVLVKSKARGGAMNNISLEDLKKVKIVIPTFDFQKVLLSKIEELFSELDNGIAQLKTAQQQLKTYRQAVLKYAFEGIKKDTFESVVKSSQNGISKRTGTGEKYKVLRLADIDELSVSNSSARLIGLSKKEIEKYSLTKGDLVCIRVNGSRDLVGNLVYISEQDEHNKWAFCDHFIRFTLDNKQVNSKFYYYYFQTIQVRKYIHDNMVTSAGQNTVSQVTIKGVEVPVCNAKKQEQIVQEIERRLSVADKLQETIDTALTQSESLRQSILKQAFEGKLVRE